MDISGQEDDPIYYLIILSAYIQKVFSIFITSSHALLAYEAFISFIVCTDFRIHITHNNQDIVSWDEVDVVLQCLIIYLFLFTVHINCKTLQYCL